MPTDIEIQSCLAKVQSERCGALTDGERVGAQLLCALRWPAWDISEHVMKRRAWTDLLARLEKVIGAGALDEEDLKAAFKMLGEKPASEIVEAIRKRVDAKGLGASLVGKLAGKPGAPSPSRGSEPGGVG